LEGWDGSVGGDGLCVGEGEEREEEEDRHGRPTLSARARPS
jgi:hypothetical protein